MSFLGMLCLGLFVGAIVMRGIDAMTGIDNFMKGMTAILAAALSGVALTFLQFLMNKPAEGQPPDKGVFMYPVGLILAVLWYFVHQTVPDLSSKVQAKRFVAWLHVLTLAAITTIAIILTAPAVLKDAGWM